PPHRVDVVGFHAIEVVLGLRVSHSEHGIRVPLPINVRDAPVIANNGGVPRLAPPPRGFLIGAPLRRDTRLTPLRKELREQVFSLALLGDHSRDRRMFQSSPFTSRGWFRFRRREKRG